MIREGRLRDLEARLPGATSVPTELPVPHIMKFALSPDFLNVDLYPRQGTLLKVVCCAPELFTDFDRRVIEEWTAGFSIVDGDGGTAGYVGTYGMVADVAQRMDYCRSLGRAMFREVLLVMGRRGSKNYLGAVLAAYSLWMAMTTGVPQRHYGIARGKQIHLMVFAAQHDQATTNQWKDLRDMITGAPCFAPYVADVSSSTVWVYSPAQLAAGNVRPRDAAFKVEACEATTASARGPATQAQLWDEMAHATGGGSNRPVEELFSAAVPAMAQFGSTSFCFQASSPWQQQGAFYSNYRRGLAVDPCTRESLDLDMLVFQAASHELYRDWEQASSSQMSAWPGGMAFPPMRQPIIDDSMYPALERIDPDEFAVEYLAQWAASVMAYLRIEDVDAMFAPWNGGSLPMRSCGTLEHTYIAHADPSRSGANFAVVIAHAEADDAGQRHVIIDSLHVWQPTNFPDGLIDYEVVYHELAPLMTRFNITQMTIDQWNSAGLLDRLKAFTRDNPNTFSHPIIEVRHATKSSNPAVAETFKTALSRRLVHAPMHALAHAELRSLESRNGKVDHPTRGPVTTSDLSDCLMSVVNSLLGDGSGHDVHAALGALHDRGTTTRDQAIYDALNSLHRPQALGRSPSRGGRFDPWRRR